MSQPPEPPAEGAEQPSEATAEIPEPPPPLYPAPPPPAYGQAPGYGQPPPGQAPGYGQPPPAYGRPPQSSPPQGYPPQGYAVRPAKQSHALRNVLLILVGLLVLGCVGAVAIVGLGINQANKAIDKAIDKTQQNDRAPGGPANPIQVQEGKPFEINGMRFLRGWRIDSAGAAGTTIEKLQVTHHRKGDAEVTELVTIKFYRHRRLLFESTCAAAPLGFGETGVLNCTPAGRVIRHYDRITVNDTF